MRAFFVCGAVCGALAISTPSLAQDTEPYGDDARTRGIVEGTIAVMVAQGVGGALAKGLSGVITRWFEPKPAQRKAPTMPTVQVRAVAADGSTRRVDPARHVFEAKERFQLRVRPAASGRLTLYGVDRDGRKLALDEVQVAAGQRAVLGPYRLPPGARRQTLQLQPPCRTPSGEGCTIRITLQRS